jgi:ABC-2 type transport system permease protein
MFLEFFRFEMRFRLKSLSTYVYFLMWTLYSFLCVASESFGPIGFQNGKVLLNGPYANSFNAAYESTFGIIVIAAIFGTSVLRDFQRDTYQILFTKPISKFAYLAGRWAGSFVTCVGVFTGVMLGAWLGTFAPWADHARIGPNHFWWYLQPFLSIVVVQIFFLGTLFFTVGALTRRIFIVYLQGAAVFMLYVIGITVFVATRSLEHFWSGILDPVGLLLINVLTRYWSVLEKNTLLLSLDFSGYSPGVFLYNRLLWVGVGLASFGALWAWFPMSVESLTQRVQGKRAARARLLADDRDSAIVTATLAPVRLPAVRQVFGVRTSLAQYWSLTSLRIRLIFREIPFWAIAAILLAFTINNGYFAGRIGGTDVWPVTFLMVQSVEGSAMLFLLIVAALYAAELIWRERDNRFDGIHDALPIVTGIDWLSKLTAIATVEAVLLALTMLVGIMMQTILGYTHFEVLQYLQELYLVTFPQVMGCAMFAMFVQTLVPNKFVGHGIVIGVWVLQPVLFNFGWESSLLWPGAIPVYVYSDMNGYGHYVPALLWSLTYWTAAFALLGVISIAFARRGSDDSFRSRSRLAWRRSAGLATVAGLLLVATVGAGGWFYYNAHVRNEFLSTEDLRHIRAEYERNFKKYELLPQPKVTAVDTSIDIDPATRSFHGSGRFTLENRTAEPIPVIHVSDAQQTVSNLKFDRASHLKERSARGDYLIYSLDQPLAPGETLTMSFDVTHQSPGFRDGNELAQFAYNGTFFDSEFLPQIGYQKTAEVDDPRRRREEHLPELQDMAPRGDPVHSHINLFTPNSDWTSYHAIVSTTDDQVAIAPGYLKRDWHKDGRHYFEYDMGAVRTLDFHAYLSGRYAVRREVYDGVQGSINLEVYYDPAHEFNVDAMLTASRAGLDYYEKNFSPFQFRQFRIMEFPRYRTLAQSFANTVPFSEGIGFITRLKKPTDVDMTTFVTAHELGHQWWGHQLIGGDVQGSNMMSETLAQYSAYMVMQKMHGKDYMHRILQHFLDRYLRGRAGEMRRERPLALVEREPYVWYDKGGQIMYTLADYIGEDQVNLALHDFLMQYRYAGDLYPDTRQLEDALRAHTPPQYQYLIDDGFDRIVLYDNKTVSATSKQLADGRYQVSLDVQARKTQVDDNGVERPMPLADYIEIGVFSGKKDEEQPLYLKREKITHERQTFTVVVDQRPTRGGIDPYNKLIDRISDDNLIDITAQ